ncbi:MAG: Gfo/Idh/MocA family oxidoreductase [Leifsonia sp.]
MKKVCLGVGFVGAGPVVQAIHLPTIARLNTRLRVTHVMDPNLDLARQVGERAGARWSQAIDDLLDDPDVDIVVICSPPRFHADQVAAAIAARKRAVLCEKPLAVELDEAVRAATAASEAGIPLVVGAMHGYDPVARAALDDWLSTGATAGMIRSRIILPQNTEFEDWATELIRPALFASPLSNAPIRDAVLSLAVHDLPLIRAVTEADAPRVVDATWFEPFGYAITWVTGETIVQMEGFFHDLPTVAWELDVYSDESRLHLEFPPSYVHAGSARSVAQSRTFVRASGPIGDDGYVAEWRHLIRILDEDGPIRSDGILGDLHLVIELADQAQARLDSKVA